MSVWSLERFQFAVTRLGGGAADELHAQLVAAWSEPSRKYHTLQHLTECLTLAADWGASLPADDQARLVLALWFHDAVYDTQSAVNERVSAEWACSALTELGIAWADAQRVVALVLATDHSEPQPDGDYLTDLMLDIDLAILGAPAARFAQYEAQVRDEYSWVAETEYAVGRRAVLAHFRRLANADPAGLYRTELGSQLLAQARENLAEPMSMPKSRRPAIYVDLDGVLSDFYGESTRILGEDYRSLPPAAAWSRLERVANLFRHLPLLPDALDLWQGLQGRGRLHILTAMPKPTGKLTTAAGDKRAWVRQHLGREVPVFVVSHGVKKAQLAAAGDILIDDLPRNIETWVAAGGVGILHRNAADTLAQLAAVLHRP